MKKTLLLLFLNPLLLFAQDQEVLIPYYKDGLYGYANLDKKIIIEPKFTQANPFGYDHIFSTYIDLALVNFQDVYYLMDRQGKLINKEEFLKKQNDTFAPAQIDQVATTSFEIIEKDGKKGISDKYGNLILAPEFKYISIYYFNTPYVIDKHTQKYATPTFASVSDDHTHSIYRLDQFKHYKNLSATSFSYNSNHLIVLFETDSIKQHGVLLKDQLILLDPMYFFVGKYYEDQKIMYATKIINGRPVTVYLDSNGNKYYEE